MHDSGFDKGAIAALLRELSDELGTAGIVAELYLVGGAALILAFGAERSTRDLDAAFAPTADVRTAAAKVASRHNLPSGWLNDAAKGFIPPYPDPGQEVFLDTEHLRVFIAGAEYLLAMKIAASRVEVDTEDISLLYKYLGLKSAREALDVAQRVFGPQYPIPPRAQYLMEEIAEVNQSAEPLNPNTQE